MTNIFMGKAKKLKPRCVAVSRLGLLGDSIYLWSCSVEMRSRNRAILPDRFSVKVT